MNAPDRSKAREPLAARMRPKRLADIVGQDHLLGPGELLSEAVAGQELPSLVLWGPPGCGKTSLGMVLGDAVGAVTQRFSAVSTGIREARALIAEARDREARTVLFVDELHRFNRAQQDAFLPHVEAGTIVFIGATTENPSFQVNAPLLSRVKVLVVRAIERRDMVELLRRALRAGQGLADVELVWDEGMLDLIAVQSSGDARRALNTLELVAALAGKGGRITPEIVERALQQRVPGGDADTHFDAISALQKSIRGSDPQAAVYWTTKLLEGGDEPLYVARRLVRTASEDVGLADPQALQVALAAKDAVHFLGMPEGALALVQAAIYLAVSPKSNAVHRAHERARAAVCEHGALAVPLHARNAPTRLATELGHGSGYRYDHDEPDAYAGLGYLPEEIAGQEIYAPGPFAFEKEIRRRLEWWKGLRETRRPAIDK